MNMNMMATANTRWAGGKRERKDGDPPGAPSAAAAEPVH